MGLGADSRYYLSQGFRVLAVEANLRAIEVAMGIDWVQPLVLSGRLSFLHAAVAPPGGGAGRTTIFAFDERPEQSNAQSWVREVGGKAEAVRGGPQSKMSMVCGSCRQDGDDDQCDGSMNFI